MKKLLPNIFRIGLLAPKSLNFGRLSQNGANRLALIESEQGSAAVTLGDRATPVAFQPSGAGVIIDVVPATPLERLKGPVLLGSVVMLVFIAGFGVWSTFAPLESAAIAPGVIAVESSRKTVQHLEGGIIDQILVKDGDQVVEGQPLVAMSDVKARAAYGSDQSQLFEAEARAARLRSERDGLSSIAFPPDLLKQSTTDPTVADLINGQQQLFLAHKSLLDAKISALQDKIGQSNDEIQGLKAQAASGDTKLNLIRAEIDDMRQLVERGLERRSRLLELQRNEAEIEGGQGQIAAQVDRAQQAIAESQVDILSVGYDDANEVGQQLRDTETKMHELEDAVRADADVLARNIVRAPEAGVVTDLRVHTPGGVVRPGDPLLDIVPEADRLIVTARVRPQDMDLVRAGLPASVRLLAYKQRRTPPIDGRVTYVSADRIIDDRPEDGQPAGQPYFRVNIALDQATLKKLPEVKLVPGMPAEVMIKTGQTTVALYTLSPILDSFNRAFREK